MAYPRGVTDLSQMTDILVQYGDPASTQYHCFAAPGSATSSAVWKIMRTVTDGSGNMTKLWASGTPAYIHVADNYASYTYS